MELYLSLISERVVGQTAQKKHKVYILKKLLSCKEQFNLIKQKSVLFPIHLFAYELLSIHLAVDKTGGSK